MNIIGDIGQLHHFIESLSIAGFCTLSSQRRQQYAPSYHMGVKTKGIRAQEEGPFGATKGAPSGRKTSR